MELKVSRGVNHIASPSLSPVSEGFLDVNRVTSQTEAAKHCHLQSCVPDAFWSPELSNQGLKNEENCLLESPGQGWSPVFLTLKTETTVLCPLCGSAAATKPPG